ncbi:hypothetical protein RhiirA1_476070 [Rhizophagus irregularis]|uniref:Uncharacterized protein n=1 Tax=Rhizophagus irregularis TaxID=588596 RepID=A0A2N0QVS7_9GLOM|nr:hypothetical protein RhiirA1_476070 [Rhizophagus irregularis]
MFLLYFCYYFVYKNISKNWSFLVKFALIPDQKIERHIRQLTPKEGKLAGRKVNICQESDSTFSEKTIKETAQHIIQDNLSEKDVKAISITLVKTASDPVVTLSCLSRLRRELRTLNAPEEIIFATKILEITRASNKI